MIEEVSFLFIYYFKNFDTIKLAGQLTFLVYFVIFSTKNIGNPP